MGVNDGGQGVKDFYNAVRAFEARLIGLVNPLFVYLYLSAFRTV